MGHKCGNREGRLQLQEGGRGRYQNLPEKVAVEERLQEVRAYPSEHLGGGGGGTFQAEGREPKQKPLDGASRAFGRTAMEAKQSG